MEFLYTEHVIEQMAERKISKDLIEISIRQPDVVFEGRFGRKIAQKAIKGKLLRIVYSTGEGSYIVITAYYTTQERYEVKK